MNFHEENASDLKLRKIYITGCFNTECAKCAIAILGDEVWLIGGWNSCSNLNICHLQSDDSFRFGILLNVKIAILTKKAAKLPLFRL